jgi:hypothetical protein
MGVFLCRSLGEVLLTVPEKVPRRGDKKEISPKPCVNPCCTQASGPTVPGCKCCGIQARIERAMRARVCPWLPIRLACWAIDLNLRANYPVVLRRRECAMQVPRIALKNDGRIQRVV